jgi:hypothetical protein
MSRDDLIAYLTHEELKFLKDNDSLEVMSAMVEFFAEGGYSKWNDADLKVKYNRMIGD